MKFEMVGRSGEEEKSVRTCYFWRGHGQGAPGARGTAANLAASAPRPDRACPRQAGQQRGTLFRRG
eukprot:12927623-Prorocentrum_lima.AAC.1